MKQNTTATHKVNRKQQQQNKHRKQQQKYEQKTTAKIKTQKTTPANIHYTENNITHN